MKKLLISLIVALSFIFGLFAPVGNVLNFSKDGDHFISKVEAKKKKSKKKKKKKSKKKKSKNKSNQNDSSNPNTATPNTDNNVNNNDSQQNTYDCVSDKYNCSDFNSCSQAKEAYNYCLNNIGYDIHKLDADNDGTPCESVCK